MVAANGAGPDPVPHQLLDAQKLTHGIQFCLSTDAMQAAHRIATRMQHESGVQTAVASFHKNLPKDLKTCEIIPGFPASWVIRKQKKKIYLSKVAVEILLDHLRISKDKLQPSDLRSPDVVSQCWLTLGIDTNPDQSTLRTKDGTLLLGSRQPEWGGR